MKDLRREGVGQVALLLLWSILRAGLCILERTITGGSGVVALRHRAADLASPAARASVCGLLLLQLR